ncbi:MAG TPA: vitamin K epoxide reductase family protein [Jatrophihabitans sp.]|nr:vitamin K epoxide reductase family protein [Jatrophihabitans sp.]
MSRPGPQRRVGLSSLIVATVGLLVSAYLTYEHFTAATTFACPESATINCQKVTTSRWSHLGPIPVAVLGLLYFAGMTLLCLPVAWRARLLVPVRVAAASVGVLVALVLVWIELFRVDAICLYCTAVHVCALTLFGTVLWTTAELRAAAVPAARLAR